MWAWKGIESGLTIFGTIYAEQAAGPPVPLGVILQEGTLHLF